MKRQQLLASALLFACAVALFLAPVAGDTAKSSPLSLWQLASDIDGRDARMVRFGVSQQSVLQEVPFPSSLIVGSARWSPDMEHLAAIIGLKPPYFSDDQRVCTFTQTGQLEWCEPIRALALYNSLPAPILWSTNSERLWVAGYAETSDYAKARVVSLDVAHKRIDASVDIDLQLPEDSYINEWNWLPEGQGAAIGIYNFSKGIFETYIVWFSPKVKYFALASAETWASEWADDSKSLAYVTDVGTYSPTEGRKTTIRIAKLNDGQLSSTVNLPVPQYENRTIDIGSVSISHRGDYLAISALPTYDALGSVHRLVFIQNVRTGQLTRLYQVPPQDKTREGWDYRIDQLTWSPDDAYIAARLRQGDISNGCSRMIILNVKGGSQEIQSGSADNRDPMWIPIEGSQAQASQKRRMLAPGPPE
jgi:hypothetical protein